MTIFSFATLYAGKKKIVAVVSFFMLLLNFRIYKRRFSQASVAALDFVACQSKKRANIWGIIKACSCSPSSRTFYYLAVKPQVTFASLSSPAVMDIRRLLALASDKVERSDARLR